MKQKKLCRVAGCTKPHWTRGYCHAEYNRLRKTGELQTLANGGAKRDIVGIELKEREMKTYGVKGHTKPNCARGYSRLRKTEELQTVLQTLDKGNARPREKPTVLVHFDESTWVIWAICGLIAAAVAVIIVGRAL